jgi:hypothetical protein
MSDERQTYRVLSDIQILDTIYPAGELVDLTDADAAAYLTAGQIALHAGNTEPFTLNEPSKAYPATPATPPAV